MSQKVQRSENYKQVSGAIQSGRRGPDKIVIAFGHDELLSVNPENGTVQTLIVLDCEILLTEQDAINLINNVREMLDKGPNKDVKC